MEQEKKTAESAQKLHLLMGILAVLVVILALAMAHEIFMIF